jgi:hypothetical protein
MKTLKLIAVGIILLVSSTSHAQLSIQLNIGTPEVHYRPANVAVTYYYLPDIQSYYDCGTDEYLFVERGNWVRSRNLPPQYRDYDSHNGYKVVLNDYQGRSPYTNFRSDRAKYYVGYRGENREYNNRRNDYNKRDSRVNKYASNDRFEKEDHREWNRR